MARDPLIVPKGLVAGLGGALVMTAVERIEQRLTGRPDSYVPARTLARLLRLDDPDADRSARMWAMHLGTGAAAGTVRAAMARANLRGPAATWLFVWLRLSVDQTLENATGVGAPPTTWPREELVIDVLHKAVYATATGLLADRLVEPAPGTSQQRPAQSLRLSGFA